jgi:hypothetical protein
MRETVKRLWPEIDWIENSKLREQVTQTGLKALERSPLRPDDVTHPIHTHGSNLPDHFHGTQTLRRAHRA